MSCAKSLTYFNQLKKLNSAMKTFIQQNTTVKTTNGRIEELKNEIEEIKQELKELEAIPNKTFDDLENIRIFNSLIKEHLQDIEEEKNRLGEPEFRGYKTIRRDYIHQLIKEYKKQSEQYQKYTNEYIEQDKKHLLYKYEDDFDNEVNVYEDGYDEFNEFVKYKSQVEDLEEEFKEQAEKVVKDMEDNGEFEKYYLVASGKQEYLNKVEKLEQIKQESLKLNDILNNYSVKFENLTIKDFETYKSIWDYLLTQKYLNEPYEFKTEPLFKIKYLNKLYDVYKYKVEDSILKDRIQCSTLEDPKGLAAAGIKKDLTNVYIKEIKDCSNIEVKPIDKIFYKGESYEVYKFEVAESVFYKRIKAKSGISNRTRDFKNIYLKKL